MAGFQKRFHHSGVSFNVYLQGFVTIHIVDLSAIDHPQWTDVASFGKVVLEAFRELVIVRAVVSSSYDPPNLWMYCFDQEGRSLTTVVLSRHHSFWKTNISDRRLFVIIINDRIAQRRVVYIFVNQWMVCRGQE